MVNRKLIFLKHKLAEATDHHKQRREQDISCYTFQYVVLGCGDWPNDKGEGSYDVTNDASKSLAQHDCAHILVRKTACQGKYRGLANTADKAEEEENYKDGPEASCVS